LVFPLLFLGKQTISSIHRLLWRTSWCVYVTSASILSACR